MFYWIVILAAGGYLLLIFLIYISQHKLLYYPDSNITRTPADIGLAYEDVYLETEDSESVHGWFVPAQNSRYTVLFFHGNAGNISGRLETIDLLHELNLNVFIIDYRGYGKSSGRPTEKGTYRDAEAAWNYLKEQRGIPIDSMIVMGRSLGAAIAADLAARIQPAGVILESPFTSVPDMAAELYPWIPARRLARFSYPTEENISKIKSPLLIAHSESDEIIPYEHGQLLYEKANQPKTFLDLQGGHNDGFLATGNLYRERLNIFISNLKNPEDEMFEK